MLTKTGKEVPVSKITPENYQPKQSDLYQYHLKLQKGGFSQETGEPLYEPYIQLVSRKDYLRKIELFKKLGFNVTTLHNPIEWEKENAKHLEMLQKQREAEQARIEAERLEKEKAEKAELEAKIKSELEAKEKAEKERIRQMMAEVMKENEKAEKTKEKAEKADK